MVDRLADPLLGGIYGARSTSYGSSSRLFPQLPGDYERDHREPALSASLAQGRAPRARARAAAAAGGPGLGVRPCRSLPSGDGQPQSTRLADAVRGARPQRGDPARHPGRGPRAGWRAHRGDPLRRDTPHTRCRHPGRQGRRRPCSPTRSRRLRSAIRTIPHGSTGVVTLRLPRRRPAGGRSSGHGFLRSRRRPTQLRRVHVHVVEVGGAGARRASLLRAFLPERSAALLDATDDAVVARRSRRPRPNRGSGGAPIVRDVARWREAMPRYTVGHLDRVAAAEAALAGAAGDRPGRRRLPRRGRAGLRGPGSAMRRSGRPLGWGRVPT